MDYVRYLRAKRSVDDRAINLRVLHEFETYLHRTAKRRPGDTLRVVEVGAGVGDMFQRLWRRNALFTVSGSVHYTLLDVKAELLEFARQSIASEFLPHSADPHLNRISVKLSSSSIADGSGIHHKGLGDKDRLDMLEDLSISDRIKVSFVIGDALNYFQTHKACFDVVIASAVLDLWELESAIQLLLDALDASSGVNAFYFPINFDGTTSFYPESCEGDAYDNCVEDEFHAAMGRRSVHGKQVQACHTGRWLAPVLQRKNAVVTSVGSSSWIVHPNNDGCYEVDEGFFLSCILDFVEATLNDKTIDKANNESQSFQNYVQYRRKQLKEGKLFYLAHNVDICGHLPMPNQA